MEPAIDEGISMTREELLKEALVDYRINLQISQPHEWQGKCAVAQKCKAYLDNGGDASRDWLLSNHIILKEAIRTEMHIVYQRIEDHRIQGKETPEFSDQHSALFDLLSLLK